MRQQNWIGKDKRMTTLNLECMNDCEDAYYYYIDLCVMYHNKQMKLLIYDSYNINSDSPPELIKTRQIVTEKHSRFRCSVCHQVAYTRAVKL